MPPESRFTVAELSRLKIELEEDRRSLARCWADAQEVKLLWTAEAPARPHLAVLAVALHGWFTGLESAFERILRVLDGGIPTGDYSHQDLLSQATIDVPGVRPAIVPRTLQPQLLMLLRFRHFFRHAYGVELQAQPLKDNLEILLRLAPEVDRALGLFVEFVAQSLAAVG